MKIEKQIVVQIFFSQDDLKELVMRSVNSIMGLRMDKETPVQFKTNEQGEIEAHVTYGREEKDEKGNA